MSGAQAKAAVICGCVGVIAEVSDNKLFRFCICVKSNMHSWVQEKGLSVSDDVSVIFT